MGLTRRVNPKKLFVVGIGLVIISATILIRGVSAGGGLFIAPIVSRPASAFGGILIGYAIASKLEISQRYVRAGLGLVFGVSSGLIHIGIYVLVTATRFLDVLLANFHYDIMLIVLIIALIETEDFLASKRGWK